MQLSGQSLPLGVVLSNFEWEIPNHAFKDYTANQTTGTVTPISEADRQYAEVECYFADAGEKEFFVSFDVDSERVTIPLKITLDEPVGSFAASYGTTKFIPPSLMILYRPPPNEGLTFNGTVSVPAGWPEGEWHYVQLVTSNRQFQTFSGNNPSAPWYHGLTVLDNSYPYFPGPHGTHPETNVGHFTTGTTDQQGGDSPATGGLGPVVQSVIVADAFSTFLMFKPDGQDSRYVPILRLDWNWNASAENTGTTEAPQWVVPEGPPSIGVPYKTSVHPMWQHNIAINPNP